MIEELAQMLQNKLQIENSLFLFFVQTSTENVKGKENSFSTIMLRQNDSKIKKKCLFYLLRNKNIY